MAKSHENGTTILLGLKVYEVGKLVEEEKVIVVEVRTDLKRLAYPRCDSANLYWHGGAKRGERFMGGIKTRRFTLRFSQRGDAVSVDIPSPEVESLCDPPKID